jgi:hypothetical protein
MAVIAKHIAYAIASGAALIPLDSRPETVSVSDRRMAWTEAGPKGWPGLHNRIRSLTGRQDRS